MADRVCLATLGRTRGLKGEMFAEPGGDWTPHELLQFRGLFLHPSGQPVELASAWEHQGRLIVKLAGVDSIEQAEALRGQQLSLPPEARPPAPEGEFYIGDLLGCRVIHAKTGEDLGVITNCFEYGGPLLMEVRRPHEGAPEGGREVLVPFAGEICRQVDIAAKRIVIDPPEGLLEL